MQRAEESDARDGGLSPLHAFLVVIAVLAAIVAAVLLTRPDEAPVPSPDPDPEPAFALTDAEAIERFQELSEIRLRSLRERDPSLLSTAFTPNSPAAKRVATSIRKLVRGGAYYKTRHDRQSIDVVGNLDEEIVIVEEIVVHPRFVDETGADISVEPVVERQTTEWTLRLVGGQWLIHDGVIVAAQPLAE